MPLLSATVALLSFAGPSASLRLSPAAPRMSAVDAPPQQAASPAPDAISSSAPLHVLIAGGGVGGLALANCLELSDAPVTYTVLERTSEFKKFGGPIQLASNAMQGFRSIDEELYKQIEARATWTGNRTNGIKDGVRDEWYAKFDLRSPAESREMPFTCVVERPELQEILMRRTHDNLRLGAGVESYGKRSDGGVVATLQTGEQVHGDVLIGADGIWSNVRAAMTETPARGEGSGVTYSGYTASEEKPDGSSPYLQKLFEGWSPEIHDILRVTQEHEIEQRDLYDRPPSVLKPWNKGRVALLGDAIHAMMPNLGQGGCQALEDALVISEQLTSLSSRGEIEGALQGYRNRRLTPLGAVQGLSRFASDIIIRGFDTPAKLGFSGGKLVAENLNYAGVVTRLLQPILPVFFAVQFAFLYDGWENKFSLKQLQIGLSIFAFGSLFLIAFAATAGSEEVLNSLGGGPPGL
ncbi:zeaxanthin epoxidase [Emiliania huxleyi CCMP1516]|uniref:FAD-binding domain-containing protein n=2 Tax=Emiliania huxleyi TaxID=2903 RepID=A0A0D3JVN1_EMIH1|nr:zeaxanthin epoxidase [Emiliania huxleyi CCMP1516]EOD27566.1 zeaxanthin epoxidase [Emiliania huxleyi CCMP1516]|eukprot:XP_005779995.1 zeaxanthin epoxidase [Emiliania huxleyi CCMP1516]